MTRYALLLALCACGSSDPGGLADSATNGTDGLRDDVTLRVNVFPVRMQAENDEDARYLALPQTLERTLPPDGTILDLQDIELATPVLQTGTVIGYRISPAVAAVPGETGPVEATVHLRVPDTVQSYVGRAGTTGAFGLWALPLRHRLEVVPDDPLLPMHTDWLDVTDPPSEQAIDLGAGVPIYGRVTSAGNDARAGARVHLIDDHGAESATAIADVHGLYQVRVDPVPGATWSVVCEGRPGDPTLTFPGLTVDEAGRNVDVAYPTDLRPVAFAGSVEDPDGAPLGGSAFRLVAEQLDGFDELHASFATDGALGDDGTFGLSVPPGVYTIEILPPPSREDLSPIRVSGVSLGACGDAGCALDPVVLEPLIPVGGRVDGPTGGLGSAQVTCVVDGFDGRAFTGFTDPTGTFAIELPAVPVSCEAEAPSGRDGLATGRLAFDPTSSDELRFALVPGVSVVGRVHTPNGEPRALVEIRDEDDRLLGSALTDGDGRFAIPVDVD